MELSPSRQLTLPHLDSSDMRSSGPSSLALRPPNFPSPGVMAGEEHQPKSQPDRIELPSIRQAVPEIISSRVPIQTTTPEYRKDRTSYSPKTGLSNTPEHAHSPSLHKRRRLSSEEDEWGLRGSNGGKRHRSPSRPTHRAESVTISPTSKGPQTNGMSSTEPWPSSSRTSPYMQPRSFTGRSSPPYDGNKSLETSNMNRSDWRPTLPSIPALTLDRGQAKVHRGRNSVSEYALDSARSGARTYPQMLTSAFDAPISSHSHPAFSYGYQQPRGQSYSGPSYDRTPFSHNHHMYPASAFQYGMTDSGHDNKQRKRRGNLPKETTDKLRSWFVAHLQHPYPSEDEKQTLMAQTGLQINQISNWFINARRRQLPALVNNAQAEINARPARDGDGHVIGEIIGENASDYGEEKRAVASGENEEEDEEYDGLQSRHTLHGLPKRGSV